MSSRTRLLTPGHTNPNQIEAIRTKATKVKQTEAATRIVPKTSAALPKNTALYPLSYREVMTI